MTEHMRAVALLRGNQRQVLLDDVAHLDGTYPLSAPFVQEEAFFSRGKLLCKSIAFCQVLSQAVAELIAIGYDALFVALARDL